MADRWVQLVLLLAFVEGAALTGAFTFVAPGVQKAAGAGSGLAGTVVAVYGDRRPGLQSGGPPAVGAAVLSHPAAHRRHLAAYSGFGVLAVHRGLVAGMVACVLLGAAWAFMHSTLQTWATSVAPKARAQVVPLFSACLFLGGSTGAALGGMLGATGNYGPLFAVSAGAVRPPHRRLRRHPPQISADP